jgi:DNA polymerase I-like protein with 3'-5' exonuclease and polymerase domains
MEGYQLSLLPLMQSDLPLAANIVQIKDVGFQNALKEWEKTDRFGFDIETFPKVPNGNAAEPETGEIRCIQIACKLSPKETKVIFLDLGWEQQERERTREFLADLGVWQLLEERLKNPAVEVVGHSLEFEQKWMLSSFGFVLRNLRDVKLASQIYWAGLDPWLEQINGKPHSLASICCRLNLPVDKTKQKSSWGWGDLEGGKLSNAQINYAAKDAEVVLEIGDILMPLLQEIGVANSYLIECAASPGFAQMSHFGMPANKSKSSAIAFAYKSACADLIKRLNSSFPEAVPHLFSPKKLTAAINAKFKLNLADSNAEQLAERWSIPEIRLISVIKTAKTYCDYVGSLEEKTGENGFVHPEFAQITRLGFGRAAARNPNVQNPPNPANFPAELAEYELPAIRSAFAPPPGKALIACDLSKIHTRIACEASQDPHLKAIFNSQSQNILLRFLLKLLAFKEWMPDGTKGI